MYSKNDYRYYLEHRMAEENYLAHYGVKGMKWKHKKNSSGDLQFDFGKFGLRIKNPKNRLKDAKNKLNGTNKQSKLLVEQDQKRGRERGLSQWKLKYKTDHDTYYDKKTKKAPNMYSTRKKSHYIDSETNHRITLSTGGSSKTYKEYGQAQKRADMKADKRDRHKVINERNPYSYDKNKSIKSNIKTNKAVSNKRKALKRKSDKQIDKLYG